MHLLDIATFKSGPNVVCFVHFDLESASRHNGVQFVISHLARWLRTRRFSEPTFRPSGASNHWKKTVFRKLATFSRTWIFFLLTLSLSSSLVFSDSSHLCFSSVHIVGSLTSKLPSIKSYNSNTNIVYACINIYMCTINISKYHDCFIMVIIIVI